MRALAPTMMFALLGVMSCEFLAGIDERSLGETPEGGLEDGGLDREGSSDSGANDAPMDARAGFCASRGATPTFCDDFDLGRLAPVWLAPTQSGGNVAIDAKNFFSAPYSLKIANDPVDAGSFTAVYEETTALAQAPATVHVEFAVQVRAAGGAESVDLFIVRIGADWTTAYTIDFQYTPDGSLSVLEGVANANYVGTAPSAPFQFTLGAWVTLELDLDFGARTLAFTVAGPSPIVTTKPLYSNASTGPLQLLAGSSHTSGPMPSWEWGIDNVLVVAR
jgi:hypothetical protein